MGTERVSLGSTVVLEVYLGTVSIDLKNRSRGKFLLYKRYGGYEDIENYTVTYKIVESNPCLERGEISYDSFIGRALMGARVGQEVEVNIGGQSVNESRAGSTTGCHQKFKVVSIET